MTKSLLMVITTVIPKSMQWQTTEKKRYYSLSFILRDSLAHLRLTCHHESLLHAVCDYQQPGGHRCFLLSFLSLLPPPSLSLDKTADYLMAFTLIFTFAICQFNFPLVRLFPRSPKQCAAKKVIHLAIIKEDGFRNHRERLSFQSEEHWSS